MRILHVIPSVSSVHGGPSSAIRTITDSLVQSGLQVEVLTTNDDGAGRKRLVSLGTPIDENGVTYWYFSKNTDFYKVSLGAALWMLREVKRFDVIHIHALFTFTSVFAAWVAYWKGVPFVIRPLGVLARYGIEKRRPFFKKVSLLLFERRLLTKAAAVHFTSRAECDESKILGVFRDVIIPLGLEDPFACTNLLENKYKRKGDELIILYLSRIDPKKNIEGLIRALALLMHEGICPRLQIAGSGDENYLQELSRLALSEGVDQQIEWMGFVAGSSKLDLLSSADLFVLPSFAENFGIAVVEAMYAGLPCILGKGVALSEDVVRVGAGVATEPDPDSIAVALKSFLDSAQKRKRAGRSARVLAMSEFSTQLMAERLVALYKRITKDTQNCVGNA